METKKCTKCGVEYELSKEFFYVAKSCRDGFTSNCKTCYIIKGKKYIQLNKDKITSYHTEWRKSNREKWRLYSVEWRKLNPEKNKAISIKRNSSLTDSYIRCKLGLTLSDSIPPKMIELKRVTIKLKREICAKTKKI